MKVFNRFISFLLFILVVDLVCSIFLIKYYSNKIGPVFMVYAESEVRRIINYVVNKSISMELDKRDIDGLFDVIRDSNNDIEMIDFNTINVNRVLVDVISSIEGNLADVINGVDSNIDISDVSDMEYKYIGNDVIFETSLGSFIGSSLIANIGPRVPVKLNMVGDVTGNIVTDVREYGINNAYMEVGINIDVKVMVYSPYISREVSVREVIPISMKVISGNIPNYYYNGFTSNSNLVGSK